MARRTREADAELIETVDDLEELVQDKRQSWRANSSKARRRQRRYKNRLTNEIDDRMKTFQRQYCSLLEAGQT